MGFQQGLSGLNAASRNLDVIGNNIANASTVGFKGAATHFADVYAASLSGGGASQVGIGVSPSAIVQQYTQGNITTTSNSLDIAINGNGFFRMSQDGAVTYSRNGQFHIDANGYLVNDTQDNVTGYIADAAGLITASTPGCFSERCARSSAVMSARRSARSGGRNFSATARLRKFLSRLCHTSPSPQPSSGASSR